MIDYFTAKNIATEFVRLLQQPAGDSLVLVENKVREEDFGWIFYYDSKRYMETEDVMFALGGNAPIIVDRREGKVSPTGTGYSIEYYIQKYREEH